MTNLARITPGSQIVLTKNDENDPESSIVATLVVPPLEEGGETLYAELGNSFGATDPAWFDWLVRSAAAFHTLPVDNSALTTDE